MTDFRDETIQLAHGSGGRATRRLIEGLFAPLLSNPALDAMGDAASLEVDRSRLAMTTDCFVVNPLSFPGGCIGSLAIHGTVNDLAVSGAEPVAITAGFVLEAGLASSVLRAQIEAMAGVARAIGVPVVAGDTKVVEHGKADGMYICTTGLGRVHERADLDPARVRPGDRVLVSGPIGDHGITILVARSEIDLETDLASDSRSVLAMTRALLDALGPGVKWMRDATRGGVATVLNELADAAGVGVAIDEPEIPVRDEVRGACELLGLDPLHVANEGQFVAVVSGEDADHALESVRSVPGGEQARLIGEITEAPARTVLGRSGYGSARVIDVLIGDPLPRIC
ncbi:MAG: hydrogenase expression/formation protein HypE [Phycisphaeraceae bacterium]|nr:MAG: hydrogenase expression/formation protein HypE [Phycisphaeraceae bacterium]